MAMEALERPAGTEVTRLDIAGTLAFRNPLERSFEAAEFACFAASFLP